MMRLFYSVAGVLLTPALRLWLLKRARRGREVPERLGERFGYASVVRPGGKLIWLHAASVGETQSILALVRAVLVEDASVHFLITTGTVTSAALVAQQVDVRIIHQFVPVDTVLSVRRFLRHWRPDLALWVESELWPQLLWQTAGRGIPMLLINARMSARSMKGWQRFPLTIRSLLHCFREIYAGSETDLQHFMQLGAAHARYAGNLKYDADMLPTDHTLLSGLSAQIGTRPVWVAASTHAGEELMVAHSQQAAQVEHPQLLCILIPRHAVRGDALAAELRAEGLMVAQRSKGETIGGHTQIYLADTMGELGNFYRLSDIVFIGGSLIPVGGHNPLEPARFSAAMMTGPYTHNFTAMVEQLVAKRAMQVVQDAEELGQAVLRLIAHDTLRLGMAERALKVVDSSSGASAVIAQRVLTYLAGGVNAHA